MLMAVYAGESADSLWQSLQSVYRQTASVQEILVVKDGPLTIPLDRILDKYKSLIPIRIIATAQRAGLARALNLGLSQVTQPWVMRFDSDDICLPNRIAEQSVQILRDEFDLFGSQIAEFEEDQTRPQLYRRVPCTQQEIKSFSLRRNPFNHMTVCFRTDMARRLGGYPEMPYMQDYGLWLKFLAHGARVNNDPRVLVLARTGRKWVRRRGGWQYVKSEIALQRLMTELHMKTPLRGCFDGIVRSVPFISPPNVREQFYRLILREPLRKSE